MEDCGFCALGEGGFYFLKKFCLVSGTLCFWACYIKNIGGAKLRKGKKKRKEKKTRRKKVNTKYQTQQVNIRDIIVPLRKVLHFPQKDIESKESAL